MSEAVYGSFLGTWILDPATCEYEQGDPPGSGTYVIEETEAGELSFTIEWEDGAGESHRVSFAGPPNGEKVPFDGGELVDAFSLTPVSARELNSSAFYRDQELMIAQRRLDESGMAMRVIQQVRLPDGSRPTNVAIYRRRVLN